MKKLALSAFALLCATGTAYAGPVAIPADSPLYIQFNNIEQVSTTGNNLTVPGYAPAAAFGDGLQANWGLFNVSSLQNGFAIPVPDHNDIAGGAGFFLDDGAGGSVGQITGIFYGIDLTSPTTAVGGVIDLYWHEVGNDTVNGSCLAGVTCLPDAATVARFTTGNSGQFLARLNFEFGVVSGDSTTTLRSNTDPTVQGGFGLAEAFASVDTTVVGAWTNILNGNWFFVDGADAGTVRGDAANEIRDMRFSTFFNVDLDSWDSATAQGLRSNDPARVFTSPVPEPATLGLLGVGLLGLVARARRRKAA